MAIWALTHPAFLTPVTVELRWLVKTKNFTQLKSFITFNTFNKIEFSKIGKFVRFALTYSEQIITVINKT